MAYKNHYLKNVILRVDFVSPEEMLKQSLLPEVKNICVKHFPIFEELKIETHQVQISREGSTVKNDVCLEKISEWHFFGKDRNNELVITHSNMFVNFKEYESFADFKSQFFMILDKLVKAYPNIKINRVGLRYIDQIELASDKKVRKSWRNYWNKYLNTHLLQGLLFADNDMAITRHMSTLEMNYGDHMLRFQYGIYNEDYPAPNKKNSFVLDTDIYAHGLFSTDEVKDSVDVYHQQAKNWFEKSIKAPLRNKMEVLDSNE